MMVPPSAFSAGKHLLSSVDTDPITLALRRAEQYWRNIPCGGAISITSGSPKGIYEVPIPANEEVAMWASFDTPAGPDNFSAPPSTFSACVIYMNPAIFPNWEEDDEHFTMLCQVMTHEVGHFEGYADANARPGTIQNAAPTKAPLVPECRHARLFYSGVWLLVTPVGVFEIHIHKAR